MSRPLSCTIAVGWWAFAGRMFSSKTLGYLVGSGYCDIRPHYESNHARKYLDTPATLACYASQM